MEFIYRWLFVICTMLEEKSTMNASSMATPTHFLLKTEYSRRSSTIRVALLIFLALICLTLLLALMLIGQVDFGLLWRACETAGASILTGGFAALVLHLLRRRQTRSAQPIRLRFA